MGGGNDAKSIVADALWFDYDNDGWQDLLVARFGTSEGAVAVAVRVNDEAVGALQVPVVGKGEWVDVHLSLPPGDATAAVTLVPEGATLGPLGGWHLARVWATEAVGE